MTNANRQLPQVLADLIVSYTVPRHAVTPNADWIGLSLTPDAMDLLHANQDRIDWMSMSANSAAMDLLHFNHDKINWLGLSTNPAAVVLLCHNPDKINWIAIAANPERERIMARCSSHKPEDWCTFKEPGGTFVICFNGRVQMSMSWPPGMFRDYQYIPNSFVSLARARRLLLQQQLLTR
jgi:hypothetical protein